MSQNVSNKKLIFKGGETLKLRNIFILFCSIFLVFNSTPISVLGQENNEEVPMNEEINDEKNNELNEGNNEEEEITEEN